MSAPLRHVVDYSDDVRLWVCSCGASAARHGTIARHAAAANDTLDALVDEAIDEAISRREDALVRAVPAVVSRQAEHMRGCPVIEAPERLTECNCWPWTDQP